MAKIELTEKFVGEIKGDFFVPSYQRGYRWGTKEVTMLLDDIFSNGERPYWLQPVVVRDDGIVDGRQRYELVDGQQRLTTLFILLSYIKRNYKPRLTISFSLTYATRDMSAAFLNDIAQKYDTEEAGKYIDFWFMANAYKAIDEWFTTIAETRGDNYDDVVASDIFNMLYKSVKVIWYEIPKEEVAVDLFTRLNIGKIPLTSAELVKALFLREDSPEIKEHQEEISLQWDSIERDLRDDSLWAFLTNNSASKYPTRINLVLDFIAQRGEKERDEYFTFFYFDRLAKSGESLYKIWQDILHTFLILKEWRYEHTLYHKIGYLISSGYKTLAEVYQESQGVTKTRFRAYLDEEIRRSVSFSKSYSELSYDNDKGLIERLLLLFNVESVRNLDEGKQWFPFDKHKQASWSLEHIHAQHSEGLDTNEKRRQWLESHLRPLKALLAANDAGGKDKAERIKSLVERMETLIESIKTDPKKTKVRELLEPIQTDVATVFTSDSCDYIHNIGNMALLNCGDNAALGNYMFAAKRDLIIEWDKNGKYIPFCTKMVFFKYYSHSEDNQMSFWGMNDRKAYIEAINKTLSEYMKEEITEGKE